MFAFPRSDWGRRFAQLWFLRFRWRRRPRAVGPLLDELTRCISSESPDSEIEASIVTALGQIAPELDGYSTDAALAEKLKLIVAWRSKNR